MFVVWGTGHVNDKNQVTKHIKRLQGSYYYWRYISSKHLLSDPNLVIINDGSKDNVLDPNFITWDILAVLMQYFVKSQYNCGFINPKQKLEIVLAEFLSV